MTRRSKVIVAWLSQLALLTSAEAPRIAMLSANNSTARRDSTVNAAVPPPISDRHLLLNTLSNTLNRTWGDYSAVESFAITCITSSVTKDELARAVGFPPIPITHTQLTNRPPMNRAMYPMWPGVPALVLHFDSNDCAVMVVDGISYWGRPPPDVIAHYGLTNGWSLPFAGHISNYLQVIRPAESRLRQQGYDSDK